MKKRLLSLLQQHNLTYDLLATYTGIPKQEVMSWVRTTKMPDYFSLIKLAEFFEVPLDFLCERINETKVLDAAVERIEKEKLKKEIARLNKELQKVSKQLELANADLAQDESEILTKYRELKPTHKDQIYFHVTTLYDNPDME